MNDSTGEGVQIRRRKLADYQPDPHNANRGNPRGRKMIADSFRDLGAGRSVLADRDGTLIAGNQSWEGAEQAGIEDVIEVETEGDVLVVVRRRDLDLDADPRARRLAIADNRTGQVNLDFDPDRLLEARELLDGLFRDDEIEDLLADSSITREVNDQLAEPVSAQRQLGDRRKQIKPVLYVDEIDIFERALRATGIRNRGQAIIEICRFYLDAHPEPDQA